MLPLYFPAVIRDTCSGWMPLISGGDCSGEGPPHPLGYLKTTERLLFSASEFSAEPGLGCSIRVRLRELAATRRLWIAYRVSNVWTDGATLFNLTK